MNSLATLESEVDEFVIAMKHANKNIADLIRAAPPATNSSTNGEQHSDTTSSNANDDITNCVDIATTITAATAAAANNATNGTSDNPDSAVPDADTTIPSDTQQPPLRPTNPDQLTAFTHMKHMWLDWGESVLRRVELYLGRWDLPVSEQVRLVGLADRLGWYGVTGSRKGVTGVR